MLNLKFLETTQIHDFHFRNKNKDFVMNKLKIFLFVFITLNMVSPAKAEVCTLAGDTAIEINRYNQCLANQMNNSQRMQMEMNRLKEEMIILREENQKLKQKLNSIRLTLKNLFLKLEL